MAVYDFLTLDVFTTRPFGGNPLAVVPDARGLDGTAMQAIANEFNLSETVFLLPPPEGSDAIATVRIFTPVNELPFAGHPNVGAAFHVASVGGVFGRDCGESFVFDERAGPVECFVERDGDALLASITAPKPLAVGNAVDRGTIAACAAIDPISIVETSHPPQLTSVGLPFVVAELDALESLAKATPVAAEFVAADRRYPTADDFFSLYLYVRDPADPTQVRSRMFAPMSNVSEDPATGSAAGALGALLASLDGPEAERRYRIVQGVEMGRRSDIDVSVAGGRARIGGPCVAVQRGTFLF